MICLGCAHLDLKASPAMSARGFGKCKHEPMSGRHVSFAFDRQCATYQLASPEIVTARAAWNEKRDA